MEVQTTRFGTIHLDDHRVVDFVGGKSAQDVADTIQGSWPK